MAIVIVIGGSLSFWNWKMFLMEFRVDRIMADDVLILQFL